MSPIIMALPVDLNTQTALFWAGILHTKQHRILWLWEKGSVLIEQLTHHTIICQQGLVGGRVYIHLDGSGPMSSWYVYPGKAQRTAPNRHLGSIWWWSHLWITNFYKWNFWRNHLTQRWLFMAESKAFFNDENIFDNRESSAHMYTVENCKSSRMWKEYDMGQEAVPISLHHFPAPQTRRPWCQKDLHILVMLDPVGLACEVLRKASYELGPAAARNEWQLLVSFFLNLWLFFSSVYHYFLKVW